jgi:NitT/TauT family transport system substrate-binding protein
MKKILIPLLLTMLALFGCSKPASDSAVPAAASSAPPPAAPASVKHYRVAWSHYTGWEPWAYAEQNGILKKWADKYGIEIELSLVNDYIESINLYTAGKFDACAMTNMDALTIPAVGGIDSQAVIVGDFSNGNDGIVMRHGKTVKDLKGRDVKLVELSVSHYLLERALDMNHMSEKDLKLTNTSDADIAGMFMSDDNGAVVTWNPQLMQVRNAPGANVVFDSSKVPGEIMDLMVVRTDAPEELKKALTGAWFETLTILNTPGPKRDEAVAFMAKNSGGSVEDFEKQLKTTAMFYTPADGAKFAGSPDVGQTMDKVRHFSFDKGLFGQGAASVDAVGIEANDGSVLGDKAKIKLRFTAKYMQAAADNQL